MVTVEIITKIFGQIAMAHKAPNHLRVNTVSLINMISDINQSNFGRTYDDVIRGTYIRRKKATRDDMKSSYGALLVLPVRYELQDLEEEGRDLLFDLIVAFPKNHLDCPKNYKPTDDQLDGRNHDIIQSFLYQFLRYRKAKIEDEGVDKFVFVRESQINDLNAIDVYGNMMSYMGSTTNLVIDNFTIGSDNLRASKIRLKISNCHTSEVDFDWEQVQGDNKSTLVSCGSCF